VFCLDVAASTRRCVEWAQVNMKIPPVPPRATGIVGALQPQADAVGYLAVQLSSIANGQGLIVSPRRHLLGSPRRRGNGEAAKRASLRAARLISFTH